MSEYETGFKAYMRFILKSKSAVAAIAVIMFLVALAVYVSTWPSSVTYNYLNNYSSISFESTHPTTAAPFWMLYLDPSAYMFNVYLKPVKSSLIEKISLSGHSYYIYELTYTFNWTKSIHPTDVYFVFAGNATIVQIAISWVKPSGSEINISLSPSKGNASAYAFDLINVKKQLVQYLLPKNISLEEKTPYYLAEVLFNRLLINKTGPVERGNYTVTVLIMTMGPDNLSRSTINLLGNAYGYMGTDNHGRSILLGILLGLPNALEIGVITSLLGVLIGAFIGGYSGFLGGKADAALNWFSTVILALPALPFLVTLGLTLKSSLSIMTEALLITFLSWPFYAIIARSAAQSIRTNAYVEADRLMGIPSYRTFLTHFLPRLVPFIVAYTVLGIPGAILLVQTLAFLGIAPPNTVTWGYILDRAYDYKAALNGYWWWILFPGLMIIVVSMPFVIVGFAIERAAFGGR